MTAQKQVSAPAAGPRKRLAFAGSKSVGQVSEIAVLSPIRRGCPPGERRTYEERLKQVVGSIAARHEQGLPTELSRVPTIHFGRIMVIRPEQYLVGSRVDGVTYHKAHVLAGTTPVPPLEAVPVQIDDFEVVHSTVSNDEPKAEFRSFVLTLVEFDGDLKVYMRDIAKHLARDFDTVFENCDNYPGTAAFDPFWAWIQRYQVSTDLFYAPYANLSVARLKALEAFRRRFDAFVARVRTPQGARVGNMDDLFDDFLRENAQHPEGFPSPGGVFAPNECEGEA